MFQQIKMIFQKNKRAESSVGMSFGVIFSIILMIVFIVFAFIAINYFLNMSKVTTTNLFYENLQNEVNRVYASPSSEKEFSFELPPKVEMICFFDFKKPATIEVEKYKEVEMYDFTGENLFLFPQRAMPSLNKKIIENINVSQSTIDENPFCIRNPSTIKLVKELIGSKTVIIKRIE